MRAMAFCSFAITDLGSSAYERAAVIFCPSTNIQARKSLMAFFFVGSLIFSGIRSQVKLDTG